MRLPEMIAITRTPLVLLFAVMVSAASADAGPYKDHRGPYRAEAYIEDWHDTERERTVPVRVYLPEVKEEGAAHPVVILSHGLGGTRDALSYLARRWASHGYICITLQHPGTDDSVWRDEEPRDRMRAMRRAARQWRPALERARDVPFALDTLEALNETEDSPLFGRIDIEHVAIAGHSFGAWTCMAMAGQGMGSNSRTTLRDDRVRVAIALSSPVPRNPRHYEPAFADIGIPVLHITGTMDTSPVNDTTAEQRRVPYDHTPGRADGGAAQYLIIFEGGDHMVLGGPQYHGGRDPLDRMREAAGVDISRDPLVHGLIQQAATAFLDAWLLGDEDAMRWLEEGGLEGTIDDDATVESK